MKRDLSKKASPPRLVALQYRDFRLLWFGRTVSGIGDWMQRTAVSWHVFQLLQGTNYQFSFFGWEMPVDASALALGLLGLVRIGPVIVFALLGGAMADSHDRRQLMIWTQSLATLIAMTLAVLTLTDQISVGLIYLLTAASAAVIAFDSPARTALVVNLVPQEHLTNAVSLNTLVMKIGTVIGPAIAGVLIGRFHIGVVYALDALSFLAVLVALLLMKFRGRPEGKSKLSWAGLVEGIQFTYRSRLIWSTMLLDFFATFFSSARTLLPIVATEVLGVGAQGYGLLATAEPVGSFLTGTVLTLRRDIRRQGLVLLISVALYGLATALFGLSTVFVLSYLFFALTGVTDTVSAVIRNVIRYVNTPDSLRGRMTSVNMIFFMGGPQLGDMEAGLVAALWGAPFSIVSGGVATILLTLWVAWKYPRLRNYTTG